MDERKRVAGTAQIQHYVKKEVLYFPAEPSDSIYILKEGKVKISRLTPDGQEIILSIVQPGEFFGELAVTGQVHREERAEVLEDSVVCLISLEDMKGLMKDIPCLNTEILKLFKLHLSNNPDYVEHHPYPYAFPCFHNIVPLLQVI